ncbi:hypothetical protein [Streptomyces sp. NPDC046821]|uniref:hypothetical protein n=1 Tax=Streptomyces sp. NPDC046821 TaxID=3154702 RepID=UPI0033C7E5B8
MDRDVTSNSARGGSTDTLPPDGRHSATTAEETTSTPSAQGGFAGSLPDGSATRARQAQAAAPGADIATSARGLYLPPMVRSHVMYSVPDGWIYWMSWNDIRVGDCTMQRPLLYLYPDGMVFFQATTSSSSSGDVWLMKALQFYDGMNEPIGHPIPQHDGMTMAWEGSQYPFVFWDAIPGVAPSGAAQIRSAAMTNHC